jgi:hypothetical protein
MDVQYLPILFLTLFWILFWTLLSINHWRDQITNIMACILLMLCVAIPVTAILTFLEARERAFARMGPEAEPIMMEFWRRGWM